MKVTDDTHRGNWTAFTPSQWDPTESQWDCLMIAPGCSQYAKMVAEKWAAFSYARWDFIESYIQDCLRIVSGLFQDCLRIVSGSRKIPQDPSGSLRIGQDCLRIVAGLSHDTPSHPANMASVLSQDCLNMTS